MKVEARDVVAIVLTLFDELYIGPGGQVSPDVLDNEWSKIGLRNSDLEQAVETLRREGALSDHRSDTGDIFYVLTNAGHKRMLDLNSPITFGLASYQRLRRNAHKRLVDRRPAPGVLHKERRRADIHA